MHSSSSKTLLRQIALAAVLGVGALLMWTIAVNWVSSVVTQLFFPQQPNEQLVFSDKGEPLVQSTTYMPHNTTVYRTLDGETIENSEKYDLQNGSSWLPGPKLPFAREWGWVSHLIGFAEPGGAPNYWYLVADVLPRGRAFLIGFDAKTNREIGYIGRGGFRADPPPPDDCFTVEPNLLSYWGLFAGPPGNQGQEPYGYWRLPNRAIFVDSGESLIRLDLRHRDVAAVPLDGKVMGVANIGHPQRVAGEKQLIEKDRIVARLSDHVVILDNEGKTLRTIPLPPETRDRTLNVYLTTGPEAIVVAVPDVRNELTEAFWLDPEGKTVRHEQLRLRGSGMFGYSEQPGWQVAVASLSPLYSAIEFAILRPRRSVTQGFYDDFRSALAGSLAENWPVFALLSALSGVLAVYAYRHQLRYSRQWAITWAALVLVTGVPGLIGYLLHRRWPARERCVECGAIVPRDRDECLVCAADFSAPAPLAIEIFG